VGLRCAAIVARYRRSGLRFCRCNKLKQWNGTAWLTTGFVSALADPGSNGIMLRTALNTTTVATAGTHYYAPGPAVASTDLRTPPRRPGGKVQAKACTAGDFVSSLNTDSTVSCTTPAGPDPATVKNNQANTYTAGSKQTFQASSTTAGSRVACAALPLVPRYWRSGLRFRRWQQVQQWNGPSWLTWVHRPDRSGAAMDW